MSDELLTPGTATHQLAIERPDEVVLVCGRAGGGQDQLTRRELDQRASALAHRLIAEGVASGQTVATVLPNSIEHMVAILATYMAGGTPFPIAYRMPEAERTKVIELAEPRVVIGEPGIGSTITVNDIIAAVRNSHVIFIDFRHKPSGVLHSKGLKDMGLTILRE